MLAAEAVVALTAGAVAELKVRIVHIGFAADRALMFIEICLLLTAYALGLSAEVYGIGTGSAGHGAHKVPTAEDEEIDQRHHRQKICREAAGNNTH